MNKVITINLNGKAYQIEENGYAILHNYLTEARKKLDGNPDQEEIVKDFEQAIAEKCDKYLSAHKNIVTSEEIKTIVKEMGPVDTTEENHEHEEQKTDSAPKRLYRIREGAWIAGVCNGVAVFFGIDVKIVRLIAVIIAIFTHGGIVALYILLAIFVPAAETSEERAFARGKQFNAEEFIEEMKEKYGKYSEKYGSKYAEKYKEKYSKYMEEAYYRKNFSNSWLSFTRLGTGIFSIIGGIALVGISIVYCVMMWAILIHGSVFGKEILVGASPALLALFVTAVTYAITWPIRTMVNEARRHAWNITRRKKHGKRIAGIVLWVIAIGFAITIGLLSTVDRATDRAPYGTDFWVLHHEVCIGGNYYCNPEALVEQHTEAVIQQTVSDFGRSLQQVSLLGPSATLKPQMQKFYGPFLAPELLKQWQEHPDMALGRETSSPYPNAIAVDNTIKNNDGSYTVTGSVVEITNADQDNTPPNFQDVTLTLVQINNEWRISAVQKGQYE